MRYSDAQERSRDWPGSRAKIALPSELEVNGVYYKLKDDVKLRSYDKLPRLVLKHGYPAAVSDAEFQALDLCDGTIDLDFPLVPEAVRDAIGGLVEKSLVEACEKGEGIKPGQALKRFPNRYLNGVQWSITGACNFRCRHCFMEAPHAKHRDLSTDELLVICDQLAEAGINEAMLTGGEPLIRKDFLEIAQRIVDDGMELAQIYTNGLLVTEELLDALEEMGARPQFCISFDGVGHHDWLRGIEGAEAAAERAFRLCHELGFPTHATLSLHSGNKDSLLATCEALASWGVKSMKVGPLADMGEWEQGGNGEPLSKEEALELYLDFVPRYLEAGMPLERVQLEGLLRIERPDEERDELRKGFESAYRKLLGVDEEEGADAGEGRVEGPVRVIVRKGAKDAKLTCLCASTRTSSYLSSEGRMLPCMMMGDIEGPVAASFPALKDASVSEILTDSTLLDAIDSRLSDLMAENAECAECEYVMDCLGGCRLTALMANPDTYFGIDPEQCKLFKGGWVDRLEAFADEMNARYAKTARDAAPAPRTFGSFVTSFAPFMHGGGEYGAFSLAQNCEDVHARA